MLNRIDIIKFALTKYTEVNMVFTEEEENLIRLGLELYKKRTELNLVRLEKSTYNSTEIDSLQSEVKTAEDIIKTTINKIK